jgi:hypothetical protein
VAWLNVFVASNLPSAVVVLTLTDGTGYDAQGGMTRLDSQSHRVVLVGEEPLLEWLPETGEPMLILYGRPGGSYSIQYRPDLGVGAWQWGAVDLVVPAKMWLLVPSPGSMIQQNFYRAVRALP